MKKYMAGLLTGILLMSILPVYAAIEEFVLYKADYKLVINEAEYADAELPLLNYKGYTYAPVRSVFDAAGLNISWNADLGQAEVTTNPEGTTETESVTGSTPTESASETAGATEEGTEGAAMESTPDLTQYNLELNVLTTQYNADIQAMESTTRDANNALYADWYSTYKNVQNSTTAQIAYNVMQGNITANNNQLAVDKAERTAVYDLAVANLKSQYGI